MRVVVGHGVVVGLAAVIAAGASEASAGETRGTMAVAVRVVGACEASLRASALEQACVGAPLAATRVEMAPTAAPTATPTALIDAAGEGVAYVTVIY